MYIRAESVPEAVKQILLSNPVYIQSIKIGIANYTALAQRIKNDVEKVMGSDININTIVVAIKRFADSLPADNTDTKPIHSIKGAKLSLTGNIIDLNIKGEVHDLLDIFNLFEKEIHGSLFRTDQYFSFFSEDIEGMQERITTALKKFDGELNEGLSRITINLAEDAHDPYQYITLISDILYNHQISIHNAFFTPKTIVLILKDSDAAKAYELIRTRITK